MNRKNEKINKDTYVLEIEEKVKEISELDYVSDAYLDKDCLSEGYLSIQIELKESEDD